MYSQLKTEFDNDAAIYDETTNYLLLDYESTLRTAVAQIRFDPTDEINILDIGCGTGNLLALVRDKFPRAHLYGIDYSHDMLEKAVSKAIDNVCYLNLNLFNVDKSSLPQFDVVLVSFVFHNFDELDEHQKALSAVYNVLAANGTFIIADLINPNDSAKSQKIQKQLEKNMRIHGLEEAEVSNWLSVLAKEDHPLTIKAISSLLQQAGFRRINTIVQEDGANAVFVAKKISSAIEIKAELLYYGVRPNKCALGLYSSQNPNDVDKTGNNGDFITVDGLNTLVSIKHEINKTSPYRLHQKRSGSLFLTKYNKRLNVSIAPIVFPSWAQTPISINGTETDFSEFFVYEGRGFVHLGYNACSFSNEQKCKFCSVERRDTVQDKTDQEICAALDAVLPTIPEDIHFCLGGGAYFPLADNVAFFKKIIATIRGKGKTNPIWVEMIPPSIEEIKELIDVGATSFGFNIEVWDNDLRRNLCPGKSQFSIGHYIEACRYVVEKLGKHAVGSCIIVGLDSYSSIKQAIDVLLSYGILPCILMYKNFDTDLGNYVIPPQIHRDYLRLSKYVAVEAAQRGIVFNKFEGCLKCNCCTIMHDIQSITEKENDYENRCT